MSSADNVCKQFGPRSGSKAFDISIVLLKEFLLEKMKKKSVDDKNIQNYIACNELKGTHVGIDS